MTLGEAKNKVYMLLDEHSAGGEVDCIGGWRERIARS